MKVNTNNKIQMLNYMDAVISSPGYFHSFVASKMPSKDDAYGETIHVILQELYDCFVKEMGKKSTNIISGLFRKYSYNKAKDKMVNYIKTN